MSDVLKKLRRKHRKGARLFSGHVKKRLKSQPVKCEQFRKSLLGKSSDVERKESDKRVHAFCCWCDHVGLELHPNLYIGEHGSCHKIGVIATGEIAVGECLAVIPREAILSCANSTIATLVREDKELENVSSSWIPLLIALAAESSLKDKSHWHSYLTLVPNNEGCGPPMLWSEADRERLLEGTYVSKLVENDLERIEHDFRNVVLPFMQKHPQVFRSEVVSCQAYKKLVSLVMSYSFTDAEDDCLTSSTMMVPFVDLLNHSSHHHAELTFHKKALRLMVVRHIKKGDEVMNTYGALPNTSLLHTYGFCEINNPHDIVPIPAECIRNVYLTSAPQGDSLTVEKRQKHWEQIVSDDLLEEDYCVDREGDPDQELLLLVKLLHCTKHQYGRLIEKIRLGSLKDTIMQDLTGEALSFLIKLAKHRLSMFPESYDTLLPLVEEQPRKIKMTEKERYALYLSVGQQQCLRTLLTDVAPRMSDGPVQHVFLMRHGERLDSMDRNWRRTAARPYDTPLTRRGHSEANRLVKQRLEGKDIELVFASPFLRCLQTAHQACLALDLPGFHTHNDLCELLSKENRIEEAPLVPCKEDAKDLNILSFDSSPQPKFPETPTECKQRYLCAMNTLADKHWPKNMLLVSHEVCVREAVGWGGCKDDVEAIYCGQVELSRTDKDSNEWKLESYQGVFKYDVLSS